MANIKIADNAGFCFGVKRAVSTIEQLLSEKQSDVYTLGYLIHNDEYNDELKRRGVRIISFEDVDDVLKNTPKDRKIAIVIRAHGELKNNLDYLLEKARFLPIYPY